MAKSIHKYVLKNIAFQQIAISITAKIIHVELQHNQICVWAEIDLDSTMAFKTFYLYATGDELPDWPGRHLKTLLVDNGRFVFHLYE